MHAMTETRPDGLTERQAEIICIIYRLTERHGHAPTFRTLAEKMGFAAPTEAVKGHMDRMQRKGWLLPVEMAGEGPRACTRTRLAGCSLKVTPLGTRLVMDTEPDGRGGFRMTEQAERLWRVVFEEARPSA